jgi:hypothetical protein
MIGKSKQKHPASWDGLGSDIRSIKNAKSVDGKKFIEKSVNSAFIVLIVNLLYCVILLNHPKSEIYNIQGDIIQHYTENIAADVDSYANPPAKDTLRTIGFPLLLKFFMLFENWLPLILGFNCAVGAWLFLMVHQLAGAKAWILAGLGAFTAYVPILYTDLLFAALFVTSIWAINRNIWVHFLFLGLASIVRPSLAWFFIIEPAVLYFYGQRKQLIILSLPIAFVVTSFNPVRNYINCKTWTHSTVLEFNRTSNMYYAGTGNPSYFIKSFKANFLSGHYDTIGAMFNKYKRDFGDKEKSKLMWALNLVCVLINALIWARFAYRTARGRVNWGNVIMILYFVLPTLFGAAGARLRLPIEYMLL